VTLHINYEHSCSNCEAYYIPYDEDVPCPNCNTLEEERFDFIPEAVTSMAFNKARFGSYTPGAWWVGSLADHILMLLFSLFDAFESENQEKLSIDSFTLKWFSNMDWGEQQYLKEHLYAIAMRVAENLQR
jgi:hypothetical protein